MKPPDIRCCQGGCAGGQYHKKHCQPNHFVTGSLELLVSAYVKDTLMFNRYFGKVLNTVELPAISSAETETQR
jgi:hypothetical protein